MERSWKLSSSLSLKQEWEAGGSGPYCSILSDDGALEIEGIVWKIHFPILTQVSCSGEWGHRETWKKQATEQTHFDVWVGAGSRDRQCPRSHRSSRWSPQGSHMGLESSLVLEFDYGYSIWHGLSFLKQILVRWKEWGCLGSSLILRWGQERWEKVVP